MIIRTNLLSIVIPQRNSTTKIRKFTVLSTATGQERSGRGGRSGHSCRRCRPESFGLRLSVQLFLRVSEIHYICHYNLQITSIVDIFNIAFAIYSVALKPEKFLCNIPDKSVNACALA